MRPLPELLLIVGPVVHAKVLRNCDPSRELRSVCCVDVEFTQEEAEVIREIPSADDLHFLFCEFSKLIVHGNSILDG